jgi:cytochrome c
MMGPEPEAEPTPGPGAGGGPVDVVPQGGGPGVEPAPEPVVSVGGSVGMAGGTGLPVEPTPVMEPVAEPETAYSDRTGPFKMLVYSKTAGFPHTDSIRTGKVMLQQIADEQMFEVAFTDTNEEFTPEGLAQYEIVFFLNTTGDIFSSAEEQIYEDWMTTQNGAFAGVHSATDTENGWGFYSEVTGQYYDLHEPCCSQANVEWDPNALNLVMVQGLPNPWPRSEEWYYFNRNSEWAAKTGFQILSRVTSNNSTRPVSYTREWSNFRAFYTSLGHEAAVFEDANVKRHVAAGIMWAVRRGHEFTP